VLEPKPVVVRGLHRNTHFLVRNLHLRGETHRRIVHRNTHENLLVHNGLSVLNLSLVGLLSVLLHLNTGLLELRHPRCGLMELGHSRMRLILGNSRLKSVRINLVVLAIVTIGVLVFVVVFFLVLFLLFLLCVTGSCVDGVDEHLSDTNVKDDADN
jgi:hypothetical protein